MYWRLIMDLAALPTAYVSASPTEVETCDSPIAGQAKAVEEVFE